MALGSKFCPTCGKPTAAASIPSPATISNDRRTLAYVLGFLITGAGHMLLGKVARGITIFMITVIIGVIWGLAFSPVMLGVAIGWWAFQLYDLHRLIKYRKPLV
jgi:TM2 domain-containing membrane protein YozV